jgi:hypothetical protein
MLLFYILTCSFAGVCHNAYAVNKKANTVVDREISGDFDVGFSYFGYGAQITSKEEHFDFTTHGKLKNRGDATNKFINRIENILINLRTTKYVHTKDSCIDEPAGVYQYDCSGFIGIFAINVILPKYCTVLNKGQRCLRKYNCGKNTNFNTVRPLASDFYNYFETMGTVNKFFGPVDLFKDVQKGDIIAIKYADAWRKKAKKYCRIYKKRNPSTGHVLIAWSSPRKSDMNGKDCCKDKKYYKSRCTKYDEYYIKVVDSAGSGHGEDSRDGCTTQEKNCAYIDNRHKGIGVGVMYFGVNDEGKPIYYRWSNWDGCKYSIYDDKDDNFQPTCNDYICKNGSLDKKGISKWSKIDGILVGRFKDEGINEHLTGPSKN